MLRQLRNAPCFPWMVSVYLYFLLNYITVLMVWLSIKTLKSLLLSARTFNVHKLIQDLPISVANTQKLN